MKHHYLNQDLNLISHYARLGSGSAARSVFGGVVTWGASSLVENSSDLFATKLNEEIHSDMKNICDTIVIIHDGVKEVSSTMGHSLMENHPFRDVRILNANNRFKELIEAMKLGDFSSWGKIIEAEALELHAMMMTSNPSYILLKPKTLDVLETVRNIRKEHSVDLYFTLDAGPNVHLLYPEKQKSQVLKLIKENITGLKLINDKTGPGPRVLKC